MKIILLILLCATAHAEDAVISTCFVPGEDCTAQIVQKIERAHSSIYIQAYGFTSAPIAKAVVDAYRRGVEVQVILDRSNRTGKYSALTFLRNAHVPAYVDASHAISHNKVMVIDEVLTITGSFNFTSAAQKSNAENVVFIISHNIAVKFYSNWLAHRAHAEAQ